MLSISDIPPETNWRCKKFQFHPPAGTRNVLLLWELLLSPCCYSIYRLSLNWDLLLNWGFLSTH